MQHSAYREWSLIEPVIEQMGYELVGTERIRNGKHLILRIYIDKPEGITVDDCAAVSHQVSGVLDVEDPIEAAYDLEVSSPGLDRPIFRAEDFARFAGERAKIKLSVPLARRRNFTGTLLGMQDGKVSVQVDQEVFELEYQHIEKAKLAPQFD